MAKQNNSLTELQALEGIYEQIEKMKEIAKRPPLLSLHLNLTSKVFVIIMALLFVLGIAGHVWFINTPMYLGRELYVSYVNRHHLSLPVIEKELKP
ncbi:MAG: hypothetical protein IJB05_05220 [Bacteroidales bacterium]|nr:hypothetical protein [Bacteroidales bacterium]